VTPLRGPYRSWLLARVALANIALIFLTFLVSAATDEGHLSLSVRVGRVLPLVPIASALAVKLTLAGAKNRGELLALEALGASPRAIALTCVAASLAAPIVASLAMLFAQVDVNGFFPAPPSAPVVLVQGATFASNDLGVVVDDRGALAPLAAAIPVAAKVALPRHARGAAAAATLLASLALALAFGRERRGLSHAVTGAAVAGALVAFQLAAARLVPAFAPLVPLMALLSVEARAYHRAR